MMAQGLKTNISFFSNSFSFDNARLREHLIFLLYVYHQDYLKIPYILFGFPVDSEILLQPKFDSESNTTLYKQRK